MSKTVLVVGGEGGIGKAICGRLANAGWNVVSADVSVQEESRSRLYLDITSQESIDQTYQKLHSIDSELDALVISSGVFDHFPVAEYAADRLESLLRVNVLGVANAINVFLRSMSKGGRVVVISSETGMVGLPFQPYGLSKRMLECYLDSLRQECRLIGIDVISIRPGAHATALLARSKTALEDIPDRSRFKGYLQKVASEGVRIIEQGAADPDAVGKCTANVLSTRRPKTHYGVNVSFRFKVMNALPVGIRERILHRSLTLRGDF